VLEAIKERGEIVTKIAYSDWKRAGDYSRLLTQHAIRMVQRNLTPGGDKNGADITMALDALEMAFTHDHINAFVIVGGDSDFISLVEKLKQYGRRVIVVGGRQFTSMTMQKNCHEFIAYENLVGSTRSSRRPERAGGRPAATDGGDIARALPLVRRALKVLSEREVTPQLGLLKSTLLQLDSTFSEREYGASSFRDFMEKVAQAGAVRLKHAGRSMLVESVDDGAPADVPTQEPAAAPPPRATRAPEAEAIGDEDEMPSEPMAMAEGIGAVRQAFSTGTPRWPMYIRQARQFLKSAIANFDERRYGFASVVDLLRAAAKEGVVRVERDRQGGMRVFPGANLNVPAPVEAPEGAVMDVPADVEAVVNAAVEAAEPVPEPITDVAAEPPIVDAEVAEVAVASADADAVAIPMAMAAETKRPRKRAARSAKATRSARAKEPVRGAKSRVRKSSRSKATEAADRR
jgi:hypothetical protein